MDKKECRDVVLLDNDIGKNTLDLLKFLNISELNTTNTIIQNISRTIFEEAFHLFVYLNFCPEEIYDSPWTKLKKDIFSNSSLDIMVLFLNRVILKTENSWAKDLLNKMTQQLELKYEKIDMMATKGLLENEDEYEWSFLHEASNHPAHIMDEKGNISPSSFIPYCYFGKQSDLLGLNIEGFKYPVCNIFEAKVLNDQLCYVVDINDKVAKGTTDKDLKAGLTLLVDYNEDRQLSLFNKTVDDDVEDEDNMMIYIHTIGKNTYSR